MGKAPASSVTRFREWRYGMFVHFGLYSLLGRHEWAMCYERIPQEEYRPLAKQFNPEPGCIRGWLELAKSCGMRYACLTTRHHDGFCLFPTEMTDYHVLNTPAGRDLIQEYVDACRELELGVGLYYSVADWSDPGFVAGPKADEAGWQRFVNVAHRQLEELMTNYGTIDYLFYDGCPPKPEFWDAVAINARIRELQPNILLSDRCQMDEDVKSAEGHTIGDPGKLWESCMTTNHSWGYNPGDPMWKTSREAVYLLATCAHNGGNLLLNVGPDGAGHIPDRAQDLLRDVGDWLQRNGEAIYGTDPHPFDYAIQKLASGRDNIGYVPLHHYHGPETVIAGIANRVERITMLGQDGEVAFRQDGNRVFCPQLPAEPPDPFLPVLRVELDGKPRGIPHPLMGYAKYQ